MEDYKGEHEYTILFEETISQSFTVHAATLEEDDKDISVEDD